MLLSGVVAAMAITPIFDRILTHRFGIIPMILYPFIAGSWLSLIWVGKEVIHPFPQRRWSKPAHYSELKSHRGALRHLRCHWDVLDTLFCRLDRARRHTD